MLDCALDLTPYSIQLLDLGQAVGNVRRRKRTGGKARDVVTLYLLYSSRNWHHVIGPLGKLRSDGQRLYSRQQGNLLQYPSVRIAAFLMLGVLQSTAYRAGPGYKQVTRNRSNPSNSKTRDGFES